MTMSAAPPQRGAGPRARWRVLVFRGPGPEFGRCLARRHRPPVRPRPPPRRERPRSGRRVRL